MPRRSLPSSDQTWQTFKTIYLELFCVALRLLRGTEVVGKDENALSEMLCVIIRQVCFKMNGSEYNRMIRPPDWEKPIPPNKENELTGGKRRKLPDFSCNYLNVHPETADQLEISLHVECKRLGRPTSPSWILNRNYVTDGIKRFDCADHRYGNGADTGIMIGYIIDMTPESIQTEVNDYQKEYLPGHKDLHFSFDTDLLHRARQEIRRIAIKPYRFEIFHLWIDLRK